VTSVNGDFWLVDEDPVNGDQPGWAVAHEATTPTGFSNDPVASVDLFAPTATAISGIDDNVPGLDYYAVLMLEPSAVTPSQSGDVVIVYNVNDSATDAGCVALVDYDANAYRPRFVDLPAGDLITALNSTSAALRQLARPTAGPDTFGKPTSTPAAAGGRTATPVQGITRSPASVRFNPQMTARGQAELKAASRAESQAAASAPWVYDPDTSPPPAALWAPGTCPSGYKQVDPVSFLQKPDGSVEVSWKNQGPDVWYWFHWQDDTSDPGIWNTNEFWSEGPNADSYPIAPPTGVDPSTSSTINQIFTLPTGTNPGDKFSFWVQAFAAGNGNVVSPDTSANAVSNTPTSPSETVSGLTATPGVNAVTLNWTAIPAPILGQSDWYSVRYMTLGGIAWSYTTDYITNTADMTPIIGGDEYEFEVAVTDDETSLDTATWSAPITATPKT
jgi:hypothetical protein